MSTPCLRMVEAQNALLILRADAQFWAWLRVSSTGVLEAISLPWLISLGSSKMGACLGVAHNAP